MISKNLRRLLIGLSFFLPSQGVIAQVAQLGPAPAQVRTLLTIDLAKICDRDVGFQCQMNKWISEPKRLTKNAQRSADLAAGHDYFTFRVEVDREEIGNHLAATVGPTESTLFLCCDRSTADYVINNLSKNERYSQDAQIIMHVKKIKKDSGAVLYVGWVRKLVLNKNPGDALFDSAFPGVRDR